MSVGVCVCVCGASVLSNKFIQNLCSENSLQIYSLDLVTLSFGRDIYSFIFCKYLVCVCVECVLGGFIKKLGVTHILIVF